MSAWSSRVAARPLWWIGLLYLIITLIGAALLALPQASAPELRFEEGDYRYKRLLNCVFTSASAATLTGLTVYDPGRDFTRFGQGVILALMQVGGFAAMTIGGLIAVRATGLDRGAAPRWIGVVVLFIVGVEATGAALLWGLWPESTGSSGERLFQSAFYAVSACCNAGFALGHDSLVPYRAEWRIYAVVLPLVIVGALGPVVCYAISRRKQPVASRARVAVVTTGVLISASSLGLFLLESRDWRDPQRRLPPEVAALMEPPMSDMTPGERSAAALFQATSARSAGLRTAALDVDALSPGSALLLSVLMLVGGAPGSAAGGISVLALAWIVLALTGRSRGLGFKPTAVRVLLAFLLLAAATTAGLAVTERGVGFIQVLFESVSAVGNSGLSMALTPRLSIAGRVIVILAMLAGRVLNVTLVAALWSAGRINAQDAEAPGRASA